MKVKWLGHASFLITADDGTRIITDPYKSQSDGGLVGYAKINEAADVVTVSHEHNDHNHTADVGGSPEVVRGAGPQDARGIRFHGVATYHDTEQGAQRGANTVFCFDVDGVKVCHLGDLGHQLSSQQLSEIGEVDVLLAVAGGGAYHRPGSAEPAGGEHEAKGGHPHALHQRELHLHQVHGGGLRQW